MSELKPSRRQLLTWLHVRTKSLEEIYTKCPDTEASKIAGRTLCMGMNSRQLTEVITEEMDSN